MFLLLAPMASAAEFLSPADKDGNVTLSSTEAHGNSYVAGSKIFANSQINGDLYAIAGDITIEGGVEQDLVVAGGTVIINGQVNGDIRVVGGEVTINNKVGGDLVVAGGTVTVSEKGSVGGDAYIAGGQITFNGPVGKETKIRGGQVMLNSTFNDKVDVEASESLTFGSKAVVESEVRYKGVSEAVVQDGAKISNVQFEKMDGHKGDKNSAGRAIAGIFSVMVLVKILGTIILGLILIKLFPRSTKELVGSFMQKPWHNMGIGFLALVVAPIAVLILMITLVGIYVGILALLVWLVFVFIASILACVFAGVWLIKTVGKRTDVQPDWKALTVGIVVLTVIALVPVIGALIFFVLLLMAFGSLLRHMHAYIKEEQNSVQTLPPVTPSEPTSF